MRDSGPGWRRRNVVWRGYSSILSSTGSTWRLRMHSDPPSALLDRVRKLLAKAEAEGVTPPEAEALTAKAAELMARYGIDRARLAADAARHRPAGQPHHRHRQPVGAGPGAPAGRAGRGHALPVRPAQHDQAGRAHPRVRLRLGPGAGRHPVHLAAAADGARPDRGGGPGRGAQRPGVAAELAARLRHRRHHPGQGGRGPGGLERGGRDAGRAEHRAGPGRPGRGHPAGSWSRRTR